MSGTHFSVAMNGHTCQIYDLNSRNGTFVEERRIVECAVAGGNVIRAGDTRFAVTLEDASLPAPADNVSPRPDNRSVLSDLSGTAWTRTAVAPPDAQNP